MAESKEKNDKGEPITFRENGSFKFPTIPCVVRKVKTERALCDVSASVSLMPYSMFHTLHLGPLQPALFSLQLVDGSVT